MFSKARIKETMQINSDQFRLDCEARHWINRTRQMGQTYWEEQKKAMLRIRGESGLKYLTNRMNELVKQEKQHASSIK
jgi:hypothetical protein